MIFETEVKLKVWKALTSDMTMFLGLAEGEPGHAGPMTARVEEDGLTADIIQRSNCRFFPSTDQWPHLENFRNATGQWRIYSRSLRYATCTAG